MSPGAKGNFISLAVALKEDSLATWFFPCIAPFLSQHPVVMDLRVDDQDQTHRFLSDGQVLGCISSRSEAVQGCNVSFLGTMDYRLVATPAFVKKWFPHGLDRESMDKVPAVIFNRRDKLHREAVLRWKRRCHTFGHPSKHLEVYLNKIWGAELI